jgi:hypothetical protein
MQKSNLISIDRLSRQYDNYMSSYPVLFQNKVLENTTYDSSLLLDERTILDMKAKLNPIIENTLTNIIPDLLFYFFFSKDNFESLQRNIRYMVHKYSGYNIGNQSESDLIIIMESIYNEYAKHVDDKGTPVDILFKHIREQLVILNKFVLQESVPIIINGILQKVGFISTFENKDTTRLDRPVNTNVSGTQVYRTIDQLRTM